MARGIVDDAGPGRRGRGAAPPTAKALAPIDLTGYWTAVITEDWHVRMLTAAKGDFGSGVAGTIENPGVGFIGAGPNPSAQGNIPYKPAAAQAAMKWDPAKDEAEGNACKAYGAPGIMRLPTHLHITWQDDNTLQDRGGLRNADAASSISAHRPTPDGWTIPTRRSFRRSRRKSNRRRESNQAGRATPSPRGRSWAGTGSFERGGSLKVVTTRLKPGYYWKNGMPYIGNAALTEYFRVMELPDKSQWIRLTHDR